MRAVIVEHLGDQGTIHDVPQPVPGDHEILVRISAAGINPVDWKARDVYEHSLPFTLGQDFAGTVAGIGKHVTRYAHGDRVFGIARTHGAYADYTVVGEDQSTEPISHIPDGIGDADAAGLPTAGLTALACVERLGVTAGSRVFIAGVTGAVGQFAAQLALDRGARVVGSGSSRHADLAKSLALEAYIAYDREDVAARACEVAPAGFDVVIDLVDDATEIGKMCALLRKGGTIGSTIRSIDENEFEQRGFVGLNINLDESPQSSHSALRALTEMVEQGRLAVPIVAERDLTDAVEALGLVKTGAIAGKAIITTN